MSATSREPATLVELFQDFIRKHSKTDGKVVHQRAIDPDNPKKTARTKREAENFLAKWRVKLETDKQPEKSKPKEITWGKFVKDYYEPIAQAKLRHYGRSAGYQLRVLNGYFESKLIHTITHFDVERALLTERRKPGREGERSKPRIVRCIGETIRAGGQQAGQAAWQEAVLRLVGGFQPEQHAGKRENRAANNGHCYRRGLRGDRRVGVVVERHASRHAENADPVPWKSQHNHADEPRPELRPHQA